MDTPLLVRSLLVGLAVAAPVGPVGVLVIRRSLAEGAAAGLATGLGAATADALFALAAALGLTAVATAATPLATALRAGGGAFLCVLGARALLRARRAPPAGGGAAGGGAAPGRALARAFGETLLLTLTSPATIVSFVAIAASLGVGPSRDGSGAAGALTLVGGVFAGSTLWWACLSAGVGALRRRVPGRTILWLDRASGVVLLAFGALALARPG